MKKAEITFNFVTPCIMAGADQKKAEIRAPSIRGQLRFWFRVLGGSPDEEKELFGGIGEGDEGRASSVVVRVKTPQEKMRTLENQTTNDATGSDFDYFLWPLSEKKKKIHEDPATFDRKKDARGVILPNKSIELEISRRAGSRAEELDKCVIKAFLLLGALGARSRRAYGSIYPADVKFDGDVWSPPGTLDELKDELSVLLACVNCTVLTLDSGLKDYKKAINKCAEFLKAFRCGKAFSGSQPSRWGQHDHDIPYKNHATINRAAVGLPLAQNYRKPNQSRSFAVFKNSSDRWASPVLFKIVAFGEENFIPVVIFLKDYFMEDGCDLVRAKNKREFEHGNGRPLKLSTDILEAMMNPARHGEVEFSGAEILF